MKTRSGVRARAPTNFTISRGQLEREITASIGEGLFWSSRSELAKQLPDLAGMSPAEYWDDRARSCRRALELLRAARSEVLPGSREELEYVIFKTENFVEYFDVLRACYDAKVALDRAWLARIDDDTAGFWNQLEQCRSAVNRADRLARSSAGEMIAYCDDKTERFLLVRYNQYVISSIERSRKDLGELIAYHQGQGNLRPVTLRPEANPVDAVAPQDR